MFYDRPRNRNRCEFPRNSAKVASFFYRSNEFGISKENVRIDMAAVFRAMTISETRGFMKALIDTKSDRILGFTMFGAGAGDVMAAVQMTMLAGLPYTALRDAVIAHPTMPEGLISLFGNVPPISAHAAKPIPYS
jgi:Pyridine nucleotide-disulphide oxidoreductase, dimerisation domain